MRRTVTALTLALLLCLSGCGSTAVQPETSAPEPTPDAAPSGEQTPFTLPYDPNAQLHPITGTNRSNLVLASLVYQGLFELDNTFTPHGVLCETASASEDGLLWTLTLADAAFSDGSPVTAADVVCSLELARGSELYADRLSGIKSIREGGDETVLISLDRPNSSLPSLLDTPIIRDPGDGSMPLGTGAYRFAEDDGPLRLTRCGGAPASAPEEIALTAIENADDLICAFDAGDVSLVVSDLTGSNALGYSSGYEAFHYPTTTMLYVGFQTGSGPCRDAAVRQILARSFDRDTVTMSLLAGHGSATCLPISPRSALYSADREDAGAFDPNAADALTHAGYTRGSDGLWYHGRSPLSLTFIVNTDNSFKLKIAEYLCEQLTRSGLQVDLQKLSWEDYLTALERGAFDLYLGEVTLTADFDLTALLTPTGTLNYGGYSNSGMTALLEQWRADGQAQTLSALLDQFQTDAPFAPLCFKDHSVLTQWRSVTGLTPTRQNPFYHLESLRFRAYSTDQN